MLAGKALGGIASIASIDWRKPWLDAWRETGPAAALAVARGASVAQALSSGLCGPTGGFVPQSALPAGEAFEAFVARTGQVPTRDNLHDFFSGLVWASHAPVKRRLNHLQALAIARDGTGPVRGAVRDALTRFDESGALLQAPPALWQALREQDWMRLFVHERALWSGASLLVFGHALLEQLVVAPRRTLTAFVWDGPELLHAPEAAWAGRPLRPLPLCGVPLWWPGNEAAAFYSDLRVFRPPRPRPARPMAPARGEIPQADKGQMGD